MFIDGAVVKVEAELAKQLSAAVRSINPLRWNVQSRVRTASPPRRTIAIPESPYPTSNATPTLGMAQGTLCPSAQS